MARAKRQVHPGHLTEITIKTFQARFLLAPNRLVNELILGVLARAQEKYGMTLCGVVVLSNHAHLLVVPESGRQLGRFCQYLKSNVSGEIGRIRQWSGGLFRGRYQDVVVTNEELAQVERLRYLLSHGVKEGLVRRPQDWPGIHLAKPLSRGTFQLKGGKWIDRTSLYEARRRARRKRLRRPRQADFTSELAVTLSKLPCWQRLSDEKYFEQTRNLIAAILTDYATTIATVPRDAVRRVLRQDPEHRPAKTKSSPKPICHAGSREERRRMREARSQWIGLYEAAAEKLREGSLEAIELFPPEAFLPRFPDVMVAAARAP